MTIFNQNTAKENSEELLYQAIKEALKPILTEIDKKFGTAHGINGLYFSDPDRIALIKETSKIVMQVIWKKLGWKIPDCTRRMVDDNFNVINCTILKNNPDNT